MQKSDRIGDSFGGSTRGGGAPVTIEKDPHGSLERSEGRPSPAGLYGPLPPTNYPTGMQP